MIKLFNKSTIILVILLLISIGGNIWLILGPGIHIHNKNENIVHNHNNNSQGQISMNFFMSRGKLEYSQKCFDNSTERIKYLNSLQVERGVLSKYYTIIEKGGFFSSDKYKYCIDVMEITEDGYIHGKGRGKKWEAVKRNGR